MKHRVTIEFEKKKRFLGIPYTVKEKEHLIVDGKAYRELKRIKQEKPYPHQVAAAAMILLEEEEEMDGCEW